MTKLEQHIQDMQVKAMNLRFVIVAIRALEESKNDEFRDERISLEDAACLMARRLDEGLDSVNLPDAKAQ